MASRMHPQRGVSLIEVLVTIVILSFGMLGLAKFQLGMVSQTTDSNARLAASAAAEEILTHVRVDLANAACYQIPAAGTCSSSFAKAQAAAWNTAVATLPGFVSAKAALSGNQFTVTLVWNAKTADETRTQTVTTDVRP